MNIVQCADRFDLSQNLLFNQQIGDIVANYNAVVFNGDCMLLNDLKASLPQFVGQ